MIIRIAISVLYFFLIELPATIIAWPCLAIALLTKWDGRTWFFGNIKHGRATDHYLAPTNGSYWKELMWMAWRNPVYNLTAKTLAITLPDPLEYDFAGDEEIGDKIAGGFYEVRLGKFWEFYWIKPYTIFGKKRCVRARIGWKIHNNTTPTAEIVCAVNPFKEYQGR